MKDQLKLENNFSIKIMRIIFKKKKTKKIKNQNIECEMYVY